MTAETPREHDARLVAPLDFPLLCDARECEMPATQGVRCRECSRVVYLLCGAHAGYLQRTRAEHPVKSQCGARGTVREVLEFRAISEWTK